MSCERGTAVTVISSSPTGRARFADDRNADDRTSTEWYGIEHVSDSVKDIQRRLGISDADVLRCSEVYQRACQASGVLHLSDLGRVLEELTGNVLDAGELATLTEHFSEPSNLVSFESLLEALVSTHAYQSEHAENMLKSIGHKSRKDIKHSLADPDTRIRFEGIPISVVRRFLDAELEQMAACLSLPFALVLFISFCCAVSFHSGIEVIHAERQALAFDLEENALFNYLDTRPLENGRVADKNFFKVNTLADFWSWLQLGLVPIFWGDHAWNVNEIWSNIRFLCSPLKTRFDGFGLVAPTSSFASEAAVFNQSCPDEVESQHKRRWQGSTPTYRYFHAFIGGVRLRQEQAVQVECPQVSTFGRNVHSGTCIEASPQWMTPEPWWGYFFGNEEQVNLPGAETTFLLAGLPPKEIIAKLQGLERSGWFSPLTNKVELVFTTYNPHIDLLMVSHLSLFLNTAGHFHHIVQSQGFWLTAFPGWWSYVADSIWLLSLAKIFVDEVAALCRWCRSSGIIKGTRSYFRKLSSWVEWLNIAAGSVILVWFYAYLADLEVLRGYLQEADFGVPGSWKNAKVREAYFDHVHRMAASSDTRFMALAVYPLVMITKVFQVCAGQPRLALVTSTISQAAVDVVHFGLVFLSVFALFTEAAVLLFGTGLPRFATFTRAADTAFHVLIGDFDWDELREPGDLPAAMWYWSFIWLLNLVMLNMMLVMIMDVYTETRGAVGRDSETLWSQAAEIYRRWRELRAGKRVSLDYIQACLGKIESDCEETNLTMFIIMEQVDGLGKLQASRLMKNALSFWDQELTQSQSLADTSMRIQAMAADFEGLKVSIGSLLHMSHLSGVLLTQGRRKPPTRIENGQEVKSDKQPAKVENGQKAQSDEVIIDDSFLDQTRGMCSPEVLERLARMEARFESRFDQFHEKLSSLESKINASIDQSTIKSQFELSRV
eukprot:TRINITY_DN91004_c0_g1_i1.p1 TRINITY_DN91004_c0_g1~~TRINITY_DN91004_c0_g1_i1.p1  ORF type:complete len:947 (-),score=135.28 TRINITY_DN91004_c0_g1_i1:85-2925(-)